MNSYYFNPTTFGNQKIPSSIDEFNDMLIKKIIYMAKLRVASNDIKTSEEYKIFKEYYHEILKWIDYIISITPFGGFDYSKKHQIKEILKSIVSTIANVNFKKIYGFSKL